MEAANGTDGISAAITGDHTADEDFATLSSHDLEHGELDFGTPVALVVLLLVFGARGRQRLMPELLALIAIIVGFGIVRCSSHRSSRSRSSS